MAEPRPQDASPAPSSALDSERAPCSGRGHGSVWSSQMDTSISMSAWPWQPLHFWRAYAPQLIQLEHQAWCCEVTAIRIGTWRRIGPDRVRRRFYYVTKFKYRQDIPTEKVRLTEGLVDRVTGLHGNCQKACDSALRITQ
ncbi:hypothetical protein VULLAG_LOCUS13393 [Vulpes lagopus]